MSPLLSHAARGWTVALALLVAATAVPGPAQERTGSPPVKVTIQDEQTVVVEPVLPLDTTRQINYQSTGVSVTVTTLNNQPLHLSHFPAFKIDGQVHQQMQPGLGGQQLYVNRPLPKDKGPKHREGFVSAYKFGDLHITVTVSLIPTKPPKGAAKRRLDSVLVHYLIENKGAKSHQFGLRDYMDTYIVDNDGCLFAAPTMPGKVLNGVELKGKKLPPYVQLLQRPDLKNPGFVAHLSLNLGGRVERPEGVVLTRFAEGFNTWECRPLMAAGDSALAVFWAIKEIRPGGKREIAYAYGQGLAVSEGDGRVELALGGSFEPGKSFKITAQVNDPVPGQVLNLELPEGMALAEGKESQPVPWASDEQPSSLVVWRARVLRPGEFTLRVRSSTGVTLGKRIGITR